MKARGSADPLRAGVREDFVAELALSRDCSEAEAAMMLREALLLTGPLTATWSHLFAGVLTVRHAKAVVDLLGGVAPEVAARVQARVLPRAGGLTAAAFRERLRHHLDRVDAEARERRRIRQFQAIRQGQRPCRPALRLIRTGGRGAGC